MSGIGYQEIGQYLDKKLSRDEAAQKIKFRTHAFARRQLVWFRKDKKIVWAKQKPSVKIATLLRQYFNKLITSQDPAKKFIEPVKNYIQLARKDKYQYAGRYSYPNEKGKKFDWGIHLGADANFQAGTPIRAIADGIVLIAQTFPGISKDHRNWGGLICIGHYYNEKRLISLYGHQKNILVKPWQKVKAGQKISEIAPKFTPENGWWEDSHIHFELYTGPYWGQVLKGYARPYQTIKNHPNPLNFFSNCSTGKNRS
jgi:murein DD-endopeptidase MepM/ murein hydrolase activator NlpD